MIIIENKKKKNKKYDINILKIRMANLYYKYRKCIKLNKIYYIKRINREDVN